MSRRLIDLTGKKFGTLTVIEYLGKSTWLCRCDCGTMKKVKGDNLRRGHVKTCGGSAHHFKGCDDDCFNCKFKDCMKLSWLCKSTEVEQW